MRRLHIALAVEDLAASIEDCSRRLGARPVEVVSARYALWRTTAVNLSISVGPERAGTLRHLGFEDAGAVSLTCTVDVNGITWELFSPEEQDRAIAETYRQP